MNVLGHRRLHRPATGSGGATCTERTSADFLIDGQSLLEMLVECAGGHADFMGCFVSGYAKECERMPSMLLDVSPESGKRVLLYICPECGDIGCGAYSVLVRPVTKMARARTSERRAFEFGQLGADVDDILSAAQSRGSSARTLLSRPALQSELIAIRVRRMLRLTIDQLQGSHAPHEEERRASPVACKHVRFSRNVPLCRNQENWCQSDLWR